MPTISVIRPADSRRRFLGAAASLAFLPAKGLTQQISTNPASQTTNPDDETANLIAQNDANRLTIEVTINGKGPYHFIVDTGAERSVIADTVAEALALPYSESVTIDAMAGRVIVPTVTVDALAFGPFMRRNLHLPVLSRTKLLVDGYLGIDAINGSRVTFDFVNHAIRIEEPRMTQTHDTSESARVKAHGSAGRLRITDCMVDSVSAIAFIDTGAEVSVGSPSLRKAMAARNKALKDLAEITLTGVTGGQVNGEVIPVGRINLEGLAFTHGTLVIADVPDFDAWHLHSRPALLIGMDYLRQFASFTIDYRFKALRFDLSLAPPKPTPGVEIVVRG